MSAIADSARLTLLLADFANGDALSKLNILGGGVGITTVNPITGLTAPVYVVVVIHVNPQFVGEHYSLEVALYGDDGQVVSPPGPTEATAIRIAQVVTVEPVPTPAGSYIPPGTVWPSAQTILSFTNGLPLAAGRGYEWRVSIDGQAVGFHNMLVAGPPPFAVG